MITRRGASLLASVLVAGLALVGCGGDDDDDTSNEGAQTSPEAPAANGVEELSANEILERVKAAATSTDAVKIAGDVAEDGQAFAIDMQYSGDAATGSLTMDGATFELLRVGADHYIKASGETWDQLTGQTGAGELLADRYVKVPGDEGSLGALTSFMSKESFIDEVLSPEGDVERGDISEVNGTQAIGLIDTDSEDPGTLWVALTGEPYPVRVEGPEGSNEGAIDFSNWGQAVDIPAPPEEDVVDLSELN